jgi:hypothetical protein
MSLVCVCGGGGICETVRIGVAKEGGATAAATGPVHAERCLPSSNVVPSD